MLKNTLSAIFFLALSGCCRPEHLIYANYPAPDSGPINILDSGNNQIPDSGGYPACTPFSIQTCYTGPAGTDLNPPCMDGTAECSETGIWGPCLGEVLPQPGTCFDCSGNPNANLPVTPCYDAGPSSNLDCDGHPENCPCHWGVVQCDQNGNEVCLGQQGPTPAVCDGVDHTCTGVVPVTESPIDILFLLDDTTYPSEDPIDSPGAMFFQPAVQTIQNFIQQYPGSNFAYGLFLLPGPESSGGFEWTTVFQMTAGNSAAMLSYLDAGLQPIIVGNAGSEPYYNLDALYAAVAPLTPATPYGPVMNVSWRPSAKKIVIMFTGDEPEASWGLPGSAGAIECGPWGNDPSVYGVYRDAGVAPIIFAPGVMDYAFVPCIQNTPGAFDAGNPFPLAGPAAMLYDLNSVLDFPCVEDGG